MEVNNFNKKPMLLFDGVGKCMVALCCKISFDENFDGFISYEAKNRLFPFYKRLGAKQTGTSIRFFIETQEAEKLVNLYFKFHVILQIYTDENSNKKRIEILLT